LRIKVSTVTAYPSGWLKERALDVAAAVAESLKKKKNQPHPLSQIETACLAVWLRVLFK